MPFVPIPLAIAQTDVDDLNTQVDDLITLIDTLNTSGIGLTKKERQEGVTVGKERKPFNDFYFANKAAYPTLKPSQTVLTEANADKHYFIGDKLNGVVAKIFTAAEKLQDIKLNSEHYSFDYSSEGRLAAKKGKENGLPGADSFFDALDELFPKTGKKPEVPEPADT